MLKNLLYVQSGGCTENKMLKKTDIGFEKISKPLVRCTLMNMFCATKHLVQGVYLLLHKYRRKYLYNEPVPTGSTRCTCISLPIHCI